MASATDRDTLQPTHRTPDVLSGRWLVDPHASHARFLAGSLAGLVKTPGRFGELSGTLVVEEAHAAGDLVIGSSSIDTGNRMRDRHLRSRDFFDVERYPQLRYEVHSLTSLDPRRARFEGELIVLLTRTRLPLDVALHAPGDGLVELACHLDVDRVALGIRGARGVVPRKVQVDLAITLRQATGSTG